MKKILVLAVAIMLVATYGVFAADPTVTDDVGIIYDGGDTLALLGIDTGNVTLTWGSSWSANTAGEQPAEAAGSPARSGSSLRYTLYGLSSAKITAKATIADLLSVDVTSIVRGTTTSKEGMTLSNTELGVPVSGATTLTTTDQEIVTDISGANTWTGWATGDGAQLEYDLVTAPDSAAQTAGVVTVTYTLVTTS